MFTSPRFLRRFLSSNSLRSSVSSSRLFSTSSLFSHSNSIRSSLSTRTIPSSINSSLFTSFRRSMFIQTQSTPNPNSLKFIPGRPVLASLNAPANASANDSNSTSASSNASIPSTLDFPTFKSASRSPLASSLFKIEGISGVFLGSDFISINISDGIQWSIIKPQVFSSIMEFYSSKQPVYLMNNNDENNESVHPNVILDSDSEIVSMIKELIETRIRPAVQEDGGDIVFRGFNESTGIVGVQMQGSCVGCSSSQITLKNGIENMLMHYVPEVKGVEEVKGELEKVSDEELKKLEQKLANVQTPK